jgi:serine O-acetyltransferase
MNTWESLKADTHRQYGRFSLGLLIKGAIFRRTFRPVVTMRLCQSIATSSALVQLTLPIFKVLHCIATHYAAIDLSWRTQAGGGLSLAHGFGLVVNPCAQIGNNVTLFNGVTLGRRDRISREGERLTEYPILEDDVWVGPHAIIVGGVIIGRGSRIAGGAFITRSIPPYSVVSGNPASIVKSNCVPDVSNSAPI